MSLQPDRLNFSVWKGATFRKGLVFHEGDENSPVRDLTGCTARLEIKTGDTVPLVLTTENGGITINGSAGEILLYVSDEATEAASWRLGKYTFFLDWPNGDVDVLLYGNFSIKDF